MYWYDIALMGVAVVPCIMLSCRYKLFVPLQSEKDAVYFVAKVTLLVSIWYCALYCTGLFSYFMLDFSMKQLKHIILATLIWTPLLTLISSYIIHINGSDETS